MGFYQDHCIFLPAMLGWFFFSAALSSYNKYVFGSSNMAFPCPLFLTSIHFFVQWLFSYGATSCYPTINSTDVIRNMSWKVFLCVSIPCGLVTCGDVGLSNLALVRITITFYTMIKASSPIFVVAFAFLFGIENVRCSLICVVFTISCGLYVTVMGEVKFDGLGFFLCIGASVMSGMRWTVVQLKISKLDPPLQSTLATMRVLSPTMFIGMVILSMLIEEPWISLSPSNGVPYFSDINNGLHTIALGLLGAILAIFMLMCEFYLIMRSNAIVLMIGGVFKELVTIFVGVYAFGDELNLINMAGCLIVFLGVIGYKVSHHTEKMQEEYTKANKLSVDYTPIKLDKKNKNGIIDIDEEFPVQIDKVLLDGSNQQELLMPPNDDDLELMDDSESRWDRISRLRISGDDSGLELQSNDPIS